MNRSNSGSTVFCFLLLILPSLTFWTAAHAGPSIEPLPLLLPSEPPTHVFVGQISLLADDSTFVQIAQLGPTTGIAFGDSDHDGLEEVFFYWGESPVADWHYWIYEEQGGNNYSLEYIGDDLRPYAVGDFDGDGLMEVVGQSGFFIKVYESLTPSSYPTNLVWTSPALSNTVGFTIVGDSDGDGKQEIIHSVNCGGSFVIYENTGDNTFTQVFSSSTLSDCTGEKLIADLDGDGNQEIIISGISGTIEIFESTADNTWARVWSDSIGLSNSCAVEGGVDTAGNGIPELFFTGDDFTTMEVKTIVYEAVGDNEFVQRAVLSAPTSAFGAADNELADLDGEVGWEYVMTVKGMFLVYQSAGPGSWIQVASNTEPLFNSNGGVFAHDVNQNGRAEIFWTTKSRTKLTLILEYPAVITDAQETRDPGFGALRIFPNPCRVEAQIQFGSNPEIQRLSVYDVSGRVVQRRMVLGARSPELDARNLAAGVYLIRMENALGRPISRGRITVMK